MSSPEDKWVWDEPEEDAAVRLPRIEPSPPPQPQSPPRASTESNESSPGLPTPAPKPAPPIEESLFASAPPAPQDAALLASLWTEVDLKSWGKKPPVQAPPDFSTLWHDNSGAPP